MHTIYYKILRIDNVNGIASEELFQQQNEIGSYVDELVEQCVGQEGDREYLFDPERLTTKTRIENIITDRNRDEECLRIANRLAQVEHSKNDEYANLMHNIPHGVLVVAIVDMEQAGEGNKVVLAKADYTEYIEQTTGVRTTGLPTRKKIFKSFIATYQIVDGNVVFPTLMTFDPQKNKASYWWNDFLELVQPRTDSDNTKTAMNVIKKDILNKIKLSYSGAYLPLYNSTMAYMKTEGDFDLEVYRDNVFGAQRINAAGFDMETWKQKITNLPNGRKKFDRHFTKIVDDITQPEVGTDIELATLVVLRIKGPFEGMADTIKAIEYEGEQGVFISSERGYTMVEGLNNREELE